MKYTLKLDFWKAPIFLKSAWFFEKRKEFMNSPDFCCCKYLCIFQYLFMHLSMHQYFWRNHFNLRFKIDIVVMTRWSIVIIINFVLTLFVSTASLSHDREPREIKDVQPHLFASYLHLRVGRVGGAWLLTEGTASLLGVSQVTLFWSGSVPNRCSMENKLALTIG